MQASSSTDKTAGGFMSVSSAFDNKMQGGGGGFAGCIAHAAAGAHVLTHACRRYCVAQRARRQAAQTDACRLA